MVDVGEKETLKYLQGFFTTSEMAGAKQEEPKKGEPAVFDFRMEFNVQQSFKTRPCVLRVLQEIAFLGCVRRDGTVAVVTCLGRCVHPVHRV